MIAVWILGTWLCAGPGATGECAPQPDERYPTRETCLAAARLARAGHPTLRTTCRQEREEG